MYLLTIIRTECFGNCTREICMNSEPEWGSAHSIAHSNLLCIWGLSMNSIPLCSPTEVLHRKAMNKTAQCRSVCASSPTCSCHIRHTGRQAELLTHLARGMTGKMTWWVGRRGERDREGGKSFGSRGRAHNEAAVGFRFIVFNGFWRQKCRLHSGDRLPSSISFIIHIRIPPQQDLSSCHYRLTARSLSTALWSPPSGFVEAPTPETHTGFNTPVSPQSSTLFVGCVDAFIGLKQLLCSLPAVYSHTQAVIPLLTTVCGHVMQSL